MNIVLHLEVTKIRQSTQVGANDVENRITLEGRLKSPDHDVSLGGVQPLSQANGTVRLVDAVEEPELHYDATVAVGRTLVMEEYGDWLVSSIVVLPHKEHREIWDRLKTDKSLRSVRLLLDDEQQNADTPEKVVLNAKDNFLVDAVDYISNRLIDWLNRWSDNPVWAMLERIRGDILDDMQRQGVTIDPARLTRVTLLKRAVLKRCIYGVDLNPMAVELAKVSLWLDAFTLGAPLSFLDHHLKLGNSLIGSRIGHVREALTTGQIPELLQAFAPTGQPVRA